jgi:Uma2 family endonuclease
MSMPVTVPRYTLRDLVSFPDDGNRYELLDGILLVTPAPALLHQRVVSRLFTLLAAYLHPDRTSLDQHPTMVARGGG